MTPLLIFLLSGLSAGIIAFLHTSNLSKEQRYKQDIAAIVAPVFALLCFGLVQLSFIDVAKALIHKTLISASIIHSPDLAIGSYLLYLLVPLLFYPIKKGLINLRTKDVISDDSSLIAQYFYEAGTMDNTSLLKEEYYYPLQYLRMAIGIFLGLLFLSFLVVYLNKAIPAYIFLVVFFLLEFYWFMNGTIGQVSLPVKVPASTKSVDYFGLWKKYQQVWSGNLAQAFLYHPTFKPAKDTDTIDKESLIINYKQDQVFKEIAQEIISTINNGKTVLLFIPDHFQPLVDIAESEQFTIIRAILFSDAYISQFYTTDIDDLKKDKRIFVNSIDQFLDRPLNIEKDKALFEWFKKLGMVVYFGYDKSLIESPESTVSVSSILKYLCQYPTDLKTIVFAEDKQNAQAAFTSNIKVNTGFKEIRIQDKHPKLTLYLNWKKELGFEHGLYEAHYNKQIGPIATLTPLPYLFGVSSIDIKATNRPYIENYENLKRDKDAWLSGYDGLKQINSHTIDSYVNHLNHQLAFEHGSKKVFFIDDHQNNAPLLFKYYNGFVKDLAFIQIFSAPHILRKYFNDHFEFFAASPILPLSYLLLKEDRTTLALSLLEKLSKCKLTLAELYNDFNETNTPRKIVLSQIKDLFLDVFGVDIIGSDYLEISEDERGTFLFSLKSDIKDHIELFKSVDFIDENNQPIFRKNKNLLFQKYSEGQYHSFNGRMYEINRIFQDGDNITIKLNNKEPHKNYYFYTEKRVISSIDISEADCLQSNMIDNSEYKVQIYRAGFLVHTNGFFEFDQNGFSLKDGDFTFHKIKAVKTRKYKNGRLLRLQFKKIDNFNIEGILTLRILFEEFCKILFPDSYQFLIFRTFSPKATKPMKVANKSIADYYQLTNQSFAPDEQIGLYIFEDSIFDLGHLRSIKDNVPYILQLMEDYLSYTIKTVGKTKINAKNIKEHRLAPEEQFLAFGLKQVKSIKDFPSPINIESAKRILSTALRNNNATRNRNPLTVNRVGFY